MANFLANGIGGTTGDSLALASPLYMTGAVWYVSSVSGGASETGADRKHPVASLAAAYALASAGDIIVLLADHDETVSAVVNVTNRVAIIGEGSTSGVPTASLTLNHATANLLQLAAEGSQLRNVLIKVPDQATTGIMVVMSADGVLLDNVHINVNDENNANAVAFSAGADDCRMRACRFTSSETDITVTAKPYPAVGILGDIFSLYMDDCVFDAGAEGFEDGSGNNWAFDGSGFDISGLHCQNLSLLAGANFKLKGATTVGYVNTATVTGSSVVEW